MPDPETWEQYRDKLCKPVEVELLGFPVQNKERLISAIISNQLLNEKIPFLELKKCEKDPSLETIGDFILDFVIIDHFAPQGKYTAKEIDDFRQFYGNNDALQHYAKKKLKLHEFIHWGSDEKNKERWDLPSTIQLADRFEMLIAIIYLEKKLDEVKKFLEKNNFFKEIEKMKII